MCACMHIYMTPENHLVDMLNLVCSTRHRQHIAPKNELKARAL
jgi:hypothetical protein